MKIQMVKLIKYLVLLCALVAFIVSAKTAIACPEIDISKAKNGSKLAVDFNVKVNSCGTLKILHVGDSNVARITDRSGGGSWPGRLKRRLSAVRVQNAGVFGITAKQYISRIKQGKVKNKKPDICIVGPLGINESLKSHGNPNLTERDVRRVAKLLKERFHCFVAVTTVLPIQRSQHQGFQKRLNKLIKKITRRSFPILEFKLKNKQIVDTVHPGPAGYKSMARQADAFISKDLLALMRIERPDSDSDGLSDLFETTQSLTDPSDPDSNDNGLNDGDEFLFQ